MWRRCFLYACLGALIQLPGATTALELFDDPPPLNELLVPIDTPVSPEQAARCTKQRKELEKNTVRLDGDGSKLALQRSHVENMGRELETMLRSRNAADRDAADKLKQAFTAAQKELDAAIAAYNAATEHQIAASDTFNRFCAGRRVSKDAETAERLKGLSPNLPFGMPTLTAAQQKEVDAYHAYLSKHIRTDDLKTAIRNHRQRTAVAKGSSSMQVSLTISPAGRLMAKELKVSSGDPTLDSIVMAAVERAQPFTPPPKIIASTPITWHLGFLGSVGK